MTIAAHIEQDTLNGQSILYRSLLLLASQNPDDHFIFFIKKNDRNILQNKNSTPVIVSPPVKNNLLLHYWYNFKLPHLLNRYNADVFINESSVCSFRTDIPQFTVIRDGDFLTSKVHRIEPVLYKRKIFPLLAKKIAGIIVTSKGTAKQIQRVYPYAANKTFTISPGLDKSFRVAGEEDKNLVKSRYTMERDFFACYINEAGKSSLLPVLKAFSQFKKWQRSAMQLVILTDHVSVHRIIKDFDLYKYKADVKEVSYTTDEEAAAIIGSSYAFLCGSSGVDKKYMAVKGMKCNVPVIFLSGEKVYDKAAIHIEGYEQLAESMMLLYKDEHFRDNLVNEGKNYAAVYTWENAAEKLREIITAPFNG